MASDGLRILGIGDGRSLNFLRWGWRLVERGHEVILVSNRFSTHPGELDDFTVFDVRRRGGAAMRIPWLRSRRFAPEIGRLARELDVDIAHAHYLLPYGWWAGLAGVRPLVVSPWGTDILVDSRTEPGRSRAKTALGAADAVVLNSEVNAAATRELGVPDELISKIIWYAELDRFSPDRRDPALREELGFPSDALVVLSLRNFRPDTNLDLVVRAFALVHAREPRARLVLGARGGPTRQDIERLIDSLGIRDAVRIERIEHDDLPRIVASADVFVTAARSDSTPASLLEAMASGLPAICGIAPSLDEWIADGEGGALVPLGDEEGLAGAILKVLSDPELARRYGERNRREVLRLVPDPGAALEELYRRVLAGGVRRRPAT